MAKAKKKDLKAIEEKLLARQAELEQQRSELERQSLGLPQSDTSGEQSWDDEADSGTATFERERDLSLAENIRDLLDKVERALAKVKDGTYGQCETCGKNIEAARLKALQYANTCIDCARKESSHR
ncbi:MAG TPA: TraR/DksA C4-type zinc finger protein [Actinomycetota bacterium]|nr:TraR/DksA C4-type zinc finger protein [Actinomycetota bacterium]